MYKRNIQLYIMRTICIICLLVHVLCFQTACTILSETPRETTNINNTWKYAQGDYTGAEQVDYDDSCWENIGIPHSFSIPYFMAKDFYVGYGWYRKHLQLDEKDLTKKLFLEFDGVFQDAEVFVNGKLAGRHVGGYTGFSINISDCAKVGDNMVAVRVNNLWQPDVAPPGRRTCIQWRYLSQCTVSEKNSRTHCLVWYVCNHSGVGGTGWKKLIGKN